MLHRTTTSKTLNVLVATPSGASGQGGIDRIMHALQGEIERTGATDVRATFAPTRGKGHVALSPFYLAAFMARMLAMRIAGKVDVIHVNLSSYGSTYRKIQVTRLARLLGIPYVLHLHGATYAEFWPTWDNHLRRSIHAMFANAAKVMVLGKVWRDFVISRCPEAEERVVIVPNATAKPTLPHSGGGEFVHLLFLGRIGERKGVPQLGEALYRMRDLPGWRATIAGDGEVEQARARTRDLGLADRVELPGWCNDNKVAELISEADVLVLPSFNENLPMSVIEGMAAGLAVVTTPVGAVEDIIHHGENGLLVPAGDVDALTSALTRTVTDANLRNRLGAAAQLFHRQRLDLGPYAEAVKDVWQSAAR